MSSEKMYSEFINQLNSGVIILDLDLNILQWNRFIELHANRRMEDVIGQSVFNIFPELPQKWFLRKVSSVTQLKSPSFCSWEQRHHLFRFPHTRPITTDSKYMAQNCTFLPMETDGVIDRICLLVEDVTDVCYYQSRLEKTMKELELATRIDGLTQVYNRKFWEECLTKEFARSKRHKSSLSLIMFDLDNFKRLNDTYGHQCGDLVLTETAKRITEFLRVADVFGRYGGEEFAIILPETDIIGAEEVGERVRKTIAETPVIFEDSPIHFSVSVGISTLTDLDTRYENLISSADMQLYRAKASGRNTVCLPEIEKIA